jgi:SAM-dependent methyltransferase
VIDLQPDITSASVTFTRNTRGDQVIYDRIGTDYASTRRPDPHWVAQIHAKLADARTLINIGAGTGSSEPDFLSVVAVEPSKVMIKQRPSSAAPAIQGLAEQLPFKDGAFDVALAVLTVHHWRDPAVGLAEMRRVARKQIVVTWDPTVFAQRFWFVRDYLPQAVAREARLATLATISTHLTSATIEAMPVPADCTDGFFGAYWRRPRAYLDQMVRNAISGLALLDSKIVDRAVERLRYDLASGRWLAMYSQFIRLDEIDLGYRLVVAGEP